jgi:hypothetical protein
MPISADVQSAITARYGQLTDAITHQPSAERAVLTPHFTDHTLLKIPQFEYNPVTVVIVKISQQSDGVYVSSQWVGVGKTNEYSVDHWVKGADGQWYLASRR